MTKKNVFTPGPLYEKRKQLLANLKKLNLKTGDIVFNSSNVISPSSFVSNYLNAASNFFFSVLSAFSPIKIEMIVF